MPIMWVINVHTTASTTSVPLTAMSMLPMFTDGKKHKKTLARLRKYTYAILSIFSRPQKLIFPAKDYKYRGNYMDGDEKTVSGLLEEAE